MDFREFGKPSRSDGWAPENFRGPRRHQQYRGAIPAGQQSTRPEERTKRLNERAARLAHDLAVKDAMAAMRCVDPQEKAALRASSAILNGFARSLKATVFA